MTSESTTPTTVTELPEVPTVKSSLLLLLGLPLGIGLALAFVVIAIGVFRTVDMHAILLGLDGLTLPLALAAALIIASVGLLIWRRPGWKVAGYCVAAVMLVALVVKSVVRVDSYYGNLVPRWNWAWAPVAQETYADYDVRAVSASAPHVSSAPLTASAEDFAGFLGNDRSGRVLNVGLSTDWEADQPRLLWKKPIGVGWAGFAIVGELAVTQEQRGEFETVVAYNALTGDELWVHGDQVRFVDTHGDGPRAVPTFHEGRIYTMGATGLLSCLDAATGELVWQRQTLEDAETNNLLWGMCGSPLIVGDLVVVTPGGGENQAIKAYRYDDGTPAWQYGDDSAAYSSPALVQLCGTRQLLSFNGEGLRAYAETGEPLWLFPWLTHGEQQRTNVAQPIVVTDQYQHAQPGSEYIVVSSGYGMGAALVRVWRESGQWRTEEEWSSKSLKSKMSNFVVVDGNIYGFDSGIFACVDLADGARRWKKGRFGHGQVLAAGDLILIQCESGEVTLLRANPEQHERIGTLDALEHKTWNNAALAGDLLIVRNDREAACFRLPLSATDRNSHVTSVRPNRQLLRSRP